MDDNPETPLDPFDLPEWGAADAPPLDLEQAAASGPAIDAPVPALVLSTLPAPVESRPIGLLSAVGSAEFEPGRLDEATASARDAALDRLVEQGTRSGAAVVAGVSFSVVSRKNQVVVLAAGTALQPPGQ